MITRAKVVLETEASEKPGYEVGSVLHGVIMELAGDKAEKLHSGKLPPFSQFCYYDREENKSIWQITALTEQAADIIFSSLLKKSEIFLRQKNKSYTLSEKSFHPAVRYSELLQKHMTNANTQRSASIHFLTACALKSRGDFLTFPTVKNIYLNLYNKWNAHQTNADIKDKELVGKLADSSKITHYRLKSTAYPLEGVYIQSFIGEVTINSRAPLALTAIRNALLEYGGYSSIGSKTALGMGGAEVSLG